MILFILPRFRNSVRDFKKFPFKGWVLFLISVVAGTSGSLAFSYALTLGKGFAYRCYSRDTAACSFCFRVYAE